MVLYRMGKYLFDVGFFVFIMMYVLIFFFMDCNCNILDYVLFLLINLIYMFYFKDIIFLFYSD